MRTVNLRVLARDYANGTIDRENYRKARDDLIAGIVAGKIRIEPREFIVPVEARKVSVSRETIPGNGNEAETFDSGYSVPSSFPSESDTTTQKWIIGSAIVVIIICCIVIISLLV